MCAPKRTAWNQSLSAMWVLGIEPGSSGLAAASFLAAPVALSQLESLELPLNEFQLDLDMLTSLESVHLIAHMYFKYQG